MARVCRETDTGGAAESGWSSVLYDVPVVSLFGMKFDGSDLPPAGMNDELARLRRMIADLEARLVASEHKAMERFAEIERNLDRVESRIEQTDERSQVRAQALEQSLMHLADRIRRLEPG